MMTALVVYMGDFPFDICAAITGTRGLASMSAKGTGYVSPARRARHKQIPHPNRRSNMSGRIRSHRRPFVLIIATALALELLAGTAAAQGQEATIFGRVTDESGAVLPGVTVTVTSPALLVRQIVDVTNVSGEYRVTALPP